MTDAQSAISKQTNNASERLSKCKSVNSSDVSQQTTGSYRLWFVVFSRQRFFDQVYIARRVDRGVPKTNFGEEGGGGESFFRKVGQNVHRARGGLKKVTKMTAYLKVLSI